MQILPGSSDKAELINESGTFCNRVERTERLILLAAQPVCPRSSLLRPLERVVGHPDEVDLVPFVSGPIGIKVGKRLGRYRLLLGHALVDHGRHTVARRR